MQTEARAEAHYRGFSGRSRFYLNGHGYFAIGETVNVFEAYVGVTRGVIEHAHYADPTSSRRVRYTIKIKLPKGHPDAYDKNDRPQYVKRLLSWDDEVTRRNPES